VRDNDPTQPRTHPTTPPAPSRILIEDPAPVVDCGRARAKRCVGDDVDVLATIIRDGHEVIRAVAQYRGPGARRWSEVPMARADADQGGDRWRGTFPVVAQGRWRVRIEAWSDAFATWHDEVTRKLAAGVTDIDSELSEAAVLLRAAAERARGADRSRIELAFAVLEDENAPVERRRAVALDEQLLAASRRAPDRTASALLAPPVEIDVDRLRARFGAWYELFPRSWGGFRGVQRELPRLAELGFDVLYFPPIHPIGRTNRKGANNALTAGPDDPGSPWAIGSSAGGHTAIDPGLGTFEEFDELVAAARAQEIEIALDFAIQCSADHPWLREHPEWFYHRPDGTLKYAENPPKRYQDIYNVNFDCEDWQGLWDALRDVVLFWCSHGVRIFRVDNPHTKPLPFWEWMIEEVRREYPDALFLAEAFTRAAMMRALARIGFNQSYTYFTWKNGRGELTEYVTELATSGMQDYFRPNFFVNTPDILTEYLQHGGPRAFEARLVLGATLSPTYGIYSGYEHCENVPVRPGSEEYLDSEKYEIKRRRLDGPLLPLVATLNRIRRENEALQHVDNITFLETENEALIAYLKRTGENAMLVVVNIDFTWPQEGVAIVPYESGLAPVFTVEDQLSGERFQWQVGRNYVRLDPSERAAHVLRVEG
jgi:starch synthase (maltosyl-transferring)